MSDNILIQLAMKDPTLKKKLLDKAHKLIDEMSFNEAQLEEIGEVMKDAIISTIGDATQEEDLYQAVSAILEEKIDKVFKNAISIRVSPASSEE